MGWALWQQTSYCRFAGAVKSVSARFSGRAGAERGRRHAAARNVAVC